MSKTLLLAHRGFSGIYPENSPLAFEKAAELGVDGVESDVHITKDGRLVIFHDAEVDRTSNGTGMICDLTYPELLKLDIGAWKSERFAGQHVWTLDQLLDFCRETKMILNLELKNYQVFYEEMEERVIDAVCSRKMEDQVFVSSFNHISMKKFKRLCPEIETGLLYDKPIWEIEQYLELSQADCIHPFWRLLDYQPELVQIAHEHQMKINVWTVDQEDHIRKMLSLHVDGIISNAPDRLLRVAKG